MGTDAGSARGQRSNETQARHRDEDDDNVDAEATDAADQARLPGRSTHSAAGTMIALVIHMTVVAETRGSNVPNRRVMIVLVA